MITHRELVRRTVKLLLRLLGCDVRDFDEQWRQWETMTPQDREGAFDRALERYRAHRRR